MNVFVITCRDKKGKTKVFMNTFFDEMRNDNRWGSNSICITEYPQLINKR